MRDEHASWLRADRARCELIERGDAKPAASLDARSTRSRLRLAIRPWRIWTSIRLEFAAEPGCMLGADPTHHRTASVPGSSALDPPRSWPSSIRSFRLRRRPDL